MFELLALFILGPFLLLAGIVAGNKFLAGDRKSSRYWWGFNISLPVTVVLLLLAGPLPGLLAFGLLLGSLAGTYRR